VRQDLVLRNEVVMEVLSGRMTKAEGARRLGLSRSYFQSLCNRAAAEIARSLAPGRPGRPEMSERERRLQEENRELSRQNARHQAQIEQQRVAIEALSHALRERRSTARPADREESEDSEVADSQLVAAVQMHMKGLRKIVIALVLGIAARTLRRYAARAQDGQRLVNRRGPGPSAPPDEDVIAELEHEIRESRGLMGAACLAVKTGASRRQAAAIKVMVLTEMERERKEGSLSVRVSGPGVMRSFDQLYVRVDGRMRVLLICADASVPYRTTIALVESYDGASVAAVIALDIALHGAPLFWRMDRARQHMTDEVLGLLDERGVLPLFGPPRHPCFYGQMERMNREHRSWLAAGPELTTGNIGHELDEMSRVLNEAVIRPILGYRTAAARWGERELPQIDRHELNLEVMDTAAGIYCELAEDRDAELLSWRRAVERVMIGKGLMTIGRGAWC
jgi:hypothetical protein